MKLPAFITAQDRTLGTRGLLAVCVLQLALTIWMARLAICAHPEKALGSISIAGGDHPSYLGAMEHYLTEGRYYFINANGDEVPAGRMPHYAAPYWLFRQFLDVPAASDAMTVLQVLLMSVAMWALARLLAEETRSRLWGALFLVAAAGSAHLVPYLFTLLPDALGVALLALTFSSWWRSVQRDRTADHWALACWLGVLVVVKPYFALLYPLIVLHWCLKRPGIAVLMRRCAQLGAPLLLLLLPWWVRNTHHFDRFFPFQQDLYAGYGYDEVELRKRELLITLGQDASTFWEPGSMACLLHPEPPLPCRFAWPAHFTQEFRDRFEGLRAHYLSYLVSGDTTQAPALLAELAAMEDRYTGEHPWRARGLNRLLLVRQFLENSGSYHLPVHASNPCYARPQLGMKLMASAGYWLSLAGLVLALAGMVLGRFRAYWPWATPALYILVLFPLVLGAVEWRVFAAAYLFDLWLLFLLVSKTLASRSTRERGPASFQSNSSEPSASSTTRS